MHKLSIITINLNNAAGLVRTVESVLSQTFKHFEFIIIDGGSKDGSLNVIEKSNGQIAYWVSEPDKGIYHAMNKGIKVASGEYCLFLNSGDWLTHNNVLTSVFDTNPNADIVAGNVYFFNTIEKRIQWTVNSPDNLTAKTIFSGLLAHQATFIKRSLFDAIGYYNEDLTIVSDWLFFLEALLERGASYQHYKGVVSYFDMNGISCDPANNNLPRREQLTILRQKYPRFIADYDRLEELENESGRWLGSHEYNVFKAFERIGLIRLGVGIRKGVRFLNRRMLKKI
ncbi:glycosyltransferase family 2 protein [Dyadobacter alkalitolerans]|uniref:glycosyltransferase family 2 protein n=1 Tax=Dyadobacter alkalitolerans TaxID=492736 RepID=UPI00040651E6|nr:glycosyltransferase family 2 protein [Dyadobacter alkalitolerans]